MEKRKDAEMGRFRISILPPLRDVSLGTLLNLSFFICKMGTQNYFKGQR